MAKLCDVYPTGEACRIVDGACRLEAGAQTRRPGRPRADRIPRPARPPPPAGGLVERLPEIHLASRHLDRSVGCDTGPPCPNRATDGPRRVEPHADGACVAVPISAPTSTSTASPTSAGRRIVVAGEPSEPSGSGAAAPPNAMMSSGRTARTPTATDRAAKASVGMTAPITTARASDPLDGLDPVVQGKIRPQVDDRDPMAAERRCEDEAAELVVRPRRHPDEHRPGAVATGPRRLERRSEAAKDGVACDVLTRDRDAPRRPGVAERSERRDHVVLDDALVGAGGKHLVEDSLDPLAVERFGRGHQVLHEHRRLFAGRRAARPAGDVAGCRFSARDDRRGSGTRRPAVRDQAPHRPKAAQRRLVIDAVAARRPCRRDDAVAPLPRAEHGLGQPGSQCGLLDRVHGWCSVLLDQRLTTLRHMRHSLYRPCTTVVRGALSPSHGGTPIWTYYPVPAMGHSRIRRDR